jgi:transcriptional regulator with XRE-family HTH domain
MQPNRKPAGEHLREWRSKRRMSQLELASEAEISARHLSFLETGRSQGPWICNATAIRLQTG